MKILSFLSSNFNLKNLRHYCNNAYHSSRSAKVKAAILISTGCSTIKSIKMTYNAHMYPKGWRLSEEENQAFQYLRDTSTEDNINPLIKMGRFLIMDATCPNDLGDLLENDMDQIAEFPDENSFSPGQCMRDLQSKILEYRQTHNNEDGIITGLEKLHKRIAQLLPWPAYIKSLW